MNLFKLLLFLFFNLIVSSSTECEQGFTNTTRSIMEISSRRKRSLLLPNSGGLKITIALGKALVGNTPKGMSISWELSNVFSGLTSLKDWLNAKPTQTVKERNLTTANKKVVPQKFNTKNYPSFVSPYYVPWKTVPNSVPFPVIYERKPRKVSSTKDDWKRILKRSHLDRGNARSKGGSLLEETISYLMGRDMKCDILRSICRSKQFLLPPGYSMIQDIVRIIFLKPVQRRGSDEVSSNVCDSVTHCNVELDNEQPFDFLDFILNPLKVV